MHNKSQLRNTNIGLLVFPIRNSNEINQGLILRFTALIAPLVREVLIITGNFHADQTHNNVNVINVKAPLIKEDRESVFSKAFRLFLAQFTVSLEMIRIRKGIDIVILFLSDGLLVLPIIVARLLSKKIVIVNSGSNSHSLRVMYPGIMGWLYATIIKAAANIGYRIAERIIVYSKSIITPLGIDKYLEKTSVVPGHYINLHDFTLKNKLNKRLNQVGYVGRLSEEKGVWNFTQAISRIVKREDNINFVIAGDGGLRSNIDGYLTAKNLYNRVKFLGWIPNNELPNLLNDLKLLVIPSYTEAGPLVLLEAIACGTPVLATNVGNVPDIIEDGVTGFILDSNSPKHIALGIERAMKHSDLEKISNNAYSHMKNFTYNTIADRYKEILSSI